MQDNLPWTRAVRRIIEKPAMSVGKALPQHVELPVEIMGHLLLADKRTASNLHTLQAFGVTHVLNVAGRSGKVADVDYAAASIASLQLNAEDEEGYEIIALHLQAAMAFIEEARRASGGRCLIHCVAGINRSGTLATAALMLHERVNVLDAVHRVKASRRIVLENHSFQAQLVELARREGLLGVRPAAEDDGQALQSRAARKPAADALSRLG